MIRYKINRQDVRDMKLRWGRGKISQATQRPTLVKNKTSGAGPRAEWLKLCALHFSSSGFAGSDPGYRPTPLISHAVVATHI